jgi:hypothetical protein
MLKDACLPWHFYWLLDVKNTSFSVATNKETDYSVQLLSQTTWDW